MAASPIMHALPLRSATGSAPPGTQQQRWPLRVLRSSQLDAQRLDQELLSLLNEQFMRVFSHFSQV